MDSAVITFLTLLVWAIVVASITLIGVAIDYLISTHKSKKELEESLDKMVEESKK